MIQIYRRAPASYKNDEKTKKHIFLLRHNLTALYSESSHQFLETCLRSSKEFWMKTNVIVKCCCCCSSCPPGVITTISKLTKTCILRLTPDNLFFVMCSKVANGGVSMWCELSQVRLPAEHLRSRGVVHPEPATWLEVLTRLPSLPAGQLLRRVPDGGCEPGEQRDLPRGDGGEPGPLAQDHPGGQVSESEADQEALPLPHHRRRAGEERNCSSQEIYFVFAL